MLLALMGGALNKANSVGVLFAALGAEREGRVFSPLRNNQIFSLEPLAYIHNQITSAVIIKSMLDLLKIRQISDRPYPHTLLKNGLQNGHDFQQKHKKPTAFNVRYFDGGIEVGAVDSITFGFGFLMFFVSMRSFMNTKAKST